jgi:septum formation protein
MLRRLAGRTHQVHSGVAIVAGGEPDDVWSCVVTTEVEFHPCDSAFIERMIRLGEWWGRAGAYAVQGAGAAMIREIRGDYWNVVGLPVPRIIERLRDMGLGHLILDSDS